MKAICYENTETNIPFWAQEDFLHEKEHYGYAYETQGYFIHFYGEAYGIQTISPGLTIIEKNNNKISLEEWVKKTFGATNIKKMKYNVGEVIKGIWKPGLYYSKEIYKALGIDEKNNLEEKQALYMLLKKLNEILLYIEPTKSSLTTYSHELRNLLILACTELENQFASLLKLLEIKPSRKYYNTNDYVKIIDDSNIKYYQISFKNYEILNTVVPFKNWSKKEPTKSIKWYDAYNKTKHNRSEYFEFANLKNVIYAIAANIILYCIRFGPYALYQNQDILSGYMNQMVNISFYKRCNTKFYVPMLSTSKDYGENIFVIDSYKNGMYKNWKQKII